ncbi:MAG TPA: HPr-rel-A system PqqD family peptide chaperone [Methylomirabilota bacterium]|nr:HPr-rel-A system PqqD family peptide chaperone [Methylomirabilota bacterium]
MEVSPPGGSSAEPRWELSEGSRLHWKHWDDEYVVFDEGSGDTHLLDPLAAEVLKALEEQPADVPALLARLGFVDDREIEAHLRATLERFRDIGLAEPARP